MPWSGIPNVVRVCSLHGAHPETACSPVRDVPTPVYAVVQHPFQLLAVGYEAPEPYTVVASPWYGDHMPLTLSLILFTGLFAFLLMWPVESRSISTLLRIWFGSIFLSDTGLVLPLM